MSLRLTTPRLFAFFLFLAAPAEGWSASAPFALPTGNRALFEPGGEEKFFVGTVGKPWSSGTFGCVRSEGWQMHEGLDIKSLERDQRGEPFDAVRAAADGTVVYVNHRPSLSNYGNYLIIKHEVDNLEIFSVYAHLREFAPGVQSGASVRQGQIIATMGRTSNTREGISKDRAHVHFELNLLLNDRFAAWYASTHASERNDHGEWNGQNLAGLDPRLILLQQAREGARFSLLEFVRNQTELCRVLVRNASFPWLKRYPVLVRHNPPAEKEGIAGYEIAFNFNGVPFQLVPRAASEFKGTARVRLLSVNEAEYHKNPCRRLVVQKAGKWQLTAKGLSLIELLLY